MITAAEHLHPFDVYVLLKNDAKLQGPKGTGQFVPVFRASPFGNGYTQYIEIEEFAGTHIIQDTAMIPQQKEALEMCKKVKDLQEKQYESMGRRQHDTASNLGVAG